MKEWKLSRCENGHTVNQGSNHCVHCGEFCAPDDLGDEGLFNCEVLDKRFGTIQDLLAARTVKIKDQAKQIADLEKSLMAKGAESVQDSVKIWKLEARIKELNCRLLVESDNNRIAEYRKKELKNEIGKWLSHVTKLDDILETLREINSAYKKAEDDIEVSCLVGEILDRPEVKALLEKDK